MSKNIVSVLTNPFEMAYGLLHQFMEVCPDNLWKEQFGGWPIWQHVYHALGSVEFFVRQDGQPAAGSLYPPAVGSFDETPAEAPERQVMKEFATTMKQVADAYMATLVDADLCLQNKGLSDRLGKPMTHAETMAVLAGHILYHLGTCDACLRQKGLKGVF